MLTVFILGSKCNLNCGFCLCNQEKEMTTKFVKKELDKCQGTVIFTGGEPLLRVDINLLCQYAKDRGLEVGVHTNAILFDRLEKADFVNLPLDGPKNIHNQLRKNNYCYVIQALEKKKTSIRISTIATKINLDEIQRIPLILKAYPNIILWRIFKYKGNNPRYQISQEEFNSLKNLKAHCITEFIDDIDDFGEWKKISL